ncbi:MAG: ATP-binding cassette domain-containing protein [Fuerstiella sp.]|nr:ATP-binding cassette domain-containing protein [Fuerstiella sp.]MCP4511714.1 ATP-binding cassette domain-containing protein [Fuerstiella sp.]MCP4857227.1 ATP-binding cassette domain-containing protein [Fuerstiella sp.]
MIELRDVSITAGQFSLQQISFKVNQGDYGVLMGQTGRGKTTILESICGLRNVDWGEILIRDQNVTDWSPGDREIGYVPQDLALFPTMSVQAHLEFALKLRKCGGTDIARRVSEFSEMLGIGHLLKRSISGLSGGERQRVALGRALSFQPSVLLLDEPFSALDESTRTEMHVLLRAVTESTGVTTLHVTHSNEEAEALANRRFILQNGVVSEAAQAM